MLADVGNVATRAGLALAAARLYGTGSAAARGNVVASSEGARVGAAMEARHDQLRTWGKWADQVLMVCSVAGGVSLTKARLRNYLVQQVRWHGPRWRRVQSAVTLVGCLAADHVGIRAPNAEVPASTHGIPRRHSRRWIRRRCFGARGVFRRGRTDVAARPRQGECRAGPDTCSPAFAPATRP